MLGLGLSLTRRRKVGAAAAFSPSDIADLRAFEADQLALSNGDPVSSFPEYSSYGRTFTAAGAARPTYVASGIGGKPSLSFSGAQAMLSDYAPILTDATIVVVFKRTGSGDDYARLVDKNFATGLWLGQNGASANQWGGGFIDDTATEGSFLTLASGSPHILTLLRDDTLLAALGEGGSVVSSRAADASSTDTTAFRLGGAAADSFFVGQIAAVFIAPRVLTATELTSITGYCGTKYGVSADAVLRPQLYTFNGTTETLRALKSWDGKRFIEQTASYTPTSGYCRDPFAWRAGATTYLCHTDGHADTPQPQINTLAIASSSDGLTFTPLARPSFAGFFELWAPKRFLDDDGVEWFSFAGSTVNPYDGSGFQIYVTRPTAAGTYGGTWVAPVQLTITGVANAIDGVLLSPSRNPRGTWVLLYKNEDVASKYLEMAERATMTGTYTRFKTGDALGFGEGIEGGWIIQQPNSDWRIYSDAYEIDAGLGWSDSSDDWATWSARSALSAPSPVTRHGAAVPILS